MKLAALFSDHMVLQRDQPVPVWGWAAPGLTVTVEFDGQRHSALAGEDGRWLVHLAPLSASAEPRDLVVADGQPSCLVVRDVLVGDVWLASGQSNMWWRVGDSAHADVEVPAASHPRIRLFTVPSRVQECPPPDIQVAWQACSPETVWPFSAVAYFFGREWQRQHAVPVGLLNASWGGTRIEAWTSREALLREPAGREAIESYERMPKDPEFARDPLAWLRGRVRPDPGNAGFDQGWASPDCDDGTWETMAVPHKWQDFDHNYSGVFWFRRVVEIPASCAGKDLVLRLGACDKHDTTYFNNEPVGSTGWEIEDAWCQPRAYRIPGTLVRAGRNVIATRVYSYMTDGGLIGPPEAMRVDVPGEAAIPLAGVWRFKVEQNFGLQAAPEWPMGPGNPNTPHILFDNMIRLLAPAALRGVLWYQGESNAGAPEKYRALFPLMIRDWRRAFARPELPFYFVQLANHKAPQARPVESGWAELREAQMLALSEPGTGMAVAIDIGEAQDIHPKNKQEVGRRLALAVSGRTGPRYRSFGVEGDAVRLRFDSADGGLKTCDGKPLNAFAISGPDGKFQWAEARIDGETVVVRSGLVREPSAVRYAWADNPAANLCGSDGLPAAPFRTDVE